MRNDVTKVILLIKQHGVVVQLSFDFSVKSMYISILDRSMQIDRKCVTTGAPQAVHKPSPLEMSDVAMLVVSCLRL